MAKAAFIGFGEVNTPIDIIIRKCEKAAKDLEDAGEELIKVYPVTDDYEEKDIKKAVAALEGKDFDYLVVCIAGWIPTHAVVKVTEHFRHKPMVLWGLCGWIEADGRLVTTADQAGTTAFSKPSRFASLRNFHLEMQLSITACFSSAVTFWYLCSSSSISKVSISVPTTRLREGPSHWVPYRFISR